MPIANTFNLSVDRAFKKRNEQAIVVFNPNFTFKKQAPGFTFQTKSKDFIN